MPHLGPLHGNGDAPLPAPVSSDPPIVAGSDGNGGALKPWHPKVLSQRHILILQMHAGGMTNNEICEALRLSPSRVSVVLSDPRAPEIIKDFAGRLAEKLEDVHVKLQLVAPEMLDGIIELARNKDEHSRIRLTALKDILDRAGYTKVERRITLGATLNEKHLDQISESLKESARAAENITYEIIEEGA